MDKKKIQASSPEQVSQMLHAHGSFHDSTLVRLVQDYAQRRVELHLDDVFSGLDGHLPKPGVIRLEGVERIVCHLPFVGGHVRVDGVELCAARRGFSLEFELTTTEWLHVDEFAVLKLVIEATLVTVSQEDTVP